MTRKQALEESFDWLHMMMEVAAQEKALDELRMIDAVSTGSAPGTMKGGDKILREERAAVIKRAGF